MSVSIIAHDRGYRLSCGMTVDRPIDEVFAFFSDASNLDAITPPRLNFQILTPPPIDMCEGSLIDYKLRLRGIPIKWRTLISEWDPPHRFVDEQVRGPYRYWRHTHTFKETENGTEVLDEVDYAVPGGALINRLFVRRDLIDIFAFRQRKLATIFQT